MKTFRKKIILISLFLILIFLVTASCSRTKPEIAFGFIKMVLYQGETEPEEYYSFFIIPEDDDGIENLEKLYIYHDREQLRWEVDKDEWIKHTHEGKEWIGTRSITTRDGILPKGLFRVVLVNKGGESSERDFVYDGIIRYPFPEFEIEDNLYTVISEWPANRLICYDRSGNYISTITLESFSGAVSELRLPQAARAVALWAEDELNYCSAFTNAQAVNR